MGHSIAPIPPARYPSIPNEPVIFFHNLMSEIVPDTIIWDTIIFARLANATAPPSRCFAPR
jgi:hypothetical protein